MQFREVAYVHAQLIKLVLAIGGEPKALAGLTNRQGQHEAESEAIGVENGGESKARLPGLVARGRGAQQPVEYGAEQEEHEEADGDGRGKDLLLQGLGQGEQLGEGRVEVLDVVALVDLGQLFDELVRQGLIVVVLDVGEACCLVRGVFVGGVTERDTSACLDIPL